MRIHSVSDNISACRRAPGSKAKLRCENDTVTVTWPTDLTFDGTVIGAPGDIQDSLIKESTYPILNLIVITSIPP